MKVLNRNLFILFFSQAIGFSAAPVIMLVGGIIGHQLTPNSGLATLPIAALITGAAVFTIPAALIMKKIGRRVGFMGAAIVSTIAAMLTAYSLSNRNFTLFCSAIFFIGCSFAFVQQYRFAAVESVSNDNAGYAVSLLLIGSIFGIFIGPEIMFSGKDLLPFGEYTGSFVGLSILFCLSAVILNFFKDNAYGHQIKTDKPPRPIENVIFQPNYIVALCAGSVAYLVMSLIMTATPVHMHEITGISLNRTKFVIQSHFVGMFLPSLFSGYLVEKLGLKTMMLVGTVVLFFSTLITFIDTTWIYYWGTMVLLGIGWNFLFISATVLLTKTYRSTEKFKAQAVNDFVVFGFAAIASLGAGSVVFLSGWNTLMWISIPILIGMIFMVLLVYKPTSKSDMP